MLMIGGIKATLGICVEEHQSLIAEASTGVDGEPSIRIAQFVYPAELTLADAPELGHALAEFLTLGGFKTQRVIFGVPARAMILRPQQLPPCDAETAAGILRIYATDQISPELGEMVFDFAGESNPAAPANVLLMGLQQRWMDQLLAIAKAAQLKVSAITPTCQAICAASSGQAPGGLILSCRANCIELISLDAGQIRSARQIGTTLLLEPLAAQLRRALAMTDSKQRAIIVWNEMPADPTLWESLKRAIAIPFTEANARWLKVNPSDLLEGQKGLTAAALATVEQPAVNFLHPRLRQPKSRRFGRRAMWIASAAALVAVVVIGALIDLARLQNQISTTADQIQSLQPAVAIARPFVASMSIADTFRPHKSRYLACIRDLTSAAYPEIRVTSFDLGSNMRGLITGHAPGEQQVLNLRDKLNASGQFFELNFKLDADTRGTSNDVSFSATFTFVPRA